MGFFYLKKCILSKRGRCWTSISGQYCPSKKVTNELSSISNFGVDTVSADRLELWAMGICRDVGNQVQGL